jgi:type VI protein secretion system component VasF
MRDFRVPLPEALHDELRSAAREADQPIIAFAQELLRAGLDQWRRTRRRQEIAAYARQIAGTAEDLDPALERAGIESLTDEQ